MGVSGTGKTTIGKLLSQTTGIPFFDGDDFHPAENIKKMSSGEPLNDVDRKGWLESLNRLAKKQLSEGAILACSALKDKYRKTLSEEIENKLIFIYLKGSFEQIKNRLESRKGHYMSSVLLKSQFDTLEEPKNAIDVSIQLSPEEIIIYIQSKLKELGLN